LPEGDGENDGQRSQQEDAEKHARRADERTANPRRFADRGRPPERNRSYHRYLVESETRMTRAVKESTGALGWSLRGSALDGIRNTSGFLLRAPTLQHVDDEEKSE
jgi:hypothetical protein